MDSQNASFCSRVRILAAASLVVLLVVGAGLVRAPRAVADSDGPNNGSPVNTAVVQNTKDGSSLFKLAFQVRSITQAATVAPGNAAVAIASCTDCQTVAIAVQVIFVVGSPTTFTPENAAVAANSDCSFCDTLATAYQFIVQSPVPVRLTAEGKHQLHDIHKALAELDASGLTIVEIKSQVDALMRDLATILSTEVEPIPGHQEGQTDARGSPASAQSDSPSSTSVSTTVTTTSTTSTSVSTSTTTSTTSTTNTTSTTTPSSTSSSS